MPQRARIGPRTQIARGHFLERGNYRLLDPRPKPGIAVGGQAV